MKNPGRDGARNSVRSAGEIDVAVAWGPYAGYFVKQQPVELAIARVAPGADRTPLPFVYEICMGVRHGDSAFKTEIEGVLDRKRDEIWKILERYGVPLVAARE